MHMDNMLCKDVEDAGKKAWFKEGELVGWGGREGDCFSLALFVYICFSFALIILYFLNFIPYGFINNSIKKYNLK